MRKKRGFGKVIITLLFIGVITGIFFISNSKEFEQNPPIISVDENIEWNGRDTIVVGLSDESGIKNYKIVALDGQKELIRLNETLEDPVGQVDVEVDLRRWQAVSTNLKLEITATDASKGNMLSGNSSTKVVGIVIDKKRPLVSTIGYSYGITKGGSALVVFKVKDENLKSIKLEANSREFVPQKFIDDDHYISLVAWPVQDKSFKATITASDRAGNKTIYPINFFLKDKNYKDSDITLKKSFIDGKITTLLAQTGGDTTVSDVEKFKSVNERMRRENAQTIEEVTKNIDPNYVVNSFSFNPIHPLKNGAAVASFGTHRSYIYGDRKISESYHMGLDMASVREADIYNDNSSYVSFAGFNGIYGNTIILYHGLGLSTIYSHCTNMYVNQGENVAKDTLIGTTGTTGLALGDHLHFGTVVQGVEVRPEEWMDKKWLNDNIFDIISSSKKLISQGS